MIKRKGRGQLLALLLYCGFMPYIHPKGVGIAPHHS